MKNAKALKYLGKVNWLVVDKTGTLESIGTLAGGIAHDLNNFLAPLMMGIDLLKRLEVNPQSLSIITSIERSTHRGANLVRQVLSFARGVDGHG